MRIIYLLVSAMLLLTACGNGPTQPKPEPHPLIGTWRLTGSDISGFSEPLRIYLTSIYAASEVAAMVDSFIIQFQQEIWTEGYAITFRNSLWTSSYGEAGTWKISGGQLLLTSGGSTDTFYYLIEQNKLILNWRKADFLRNIFESVEDVEDAEEANFFQSVLLHTPDTANVMGLIFTKQ